MSKKSDDRKNVVIVGGGGYGGGLARDLSSKLDASKYNLTLISARPYYIHLVSVVRFTVTSEGKLEDRALIPYDQLFVKNNGTFLLGKVTAIEDHGKGQGGEVVLQSGEKVHYDVLVLATGSSWTGSLDFPDSDSDVRATIGSWRQKYAGANEIVFVGGGAVGIETAGEVRDAFPNKKITIVHGANQLLNDTYPAKYRQTIFNKVRQRNIDVILGDYIESIPADGTVGLTTRNDKELPNVDLVVPSFGGRPNTAVISTLGSDVLNERGFVKVNPTLELPNHPGIFASGDIIDWPEQKQLGKAAGHIATLSANIQSFLAGQKLVKIYKSPPEMIFVNIGKSSGAAYLNLLWGITLGDWAVSMVKGKGLLISMYRSKFGLTK